MADFMIAMADISQKSKILEPSCGEGVFLDLLKQKGFNIEFNKLTNSYVISW